MTDINNIDIRQNATRGSFNAERSHFADPSTRSTDPFGRLHLHN